jgi:flagellar basal-body rod protein FlgG
MSGTIYQAAAGALLQQMRLDMLSNNLANINTAGYKADAPVFRLPPNDLPDVQAPVGLAVTPSGISPYAPPLEARTDFTSGSLERTGNPLDVAIVGRGFFEVQAPEGSRFTRKGNLTVNDQGTLATAEGWPLMGQGGEIAVDGSRVEINGAGDVYVDGQMVDTLRIVEFDAPDQLRKTGYTFFVPQEGVMPRTVEEGTTQIAQGYVESSNVDPIRTMTEMIETLRVFESYQRIMRTADEATAKTVNEVGARA